MFIIYYNNRQVKALNFHWNWLWAFIFWLMITLRSFIIILLSNNFMVSWNGFKSFIIHFSDEDAVKYYFLRIFIYGTVVFILTS